MVTVSWKNVMQYVKKETCFYSIEKKKAATKQRLGGPTVFSLFIKMTLEKLKKNGWNEI